MTYEKCRQCSRIRGIYSNDAPGDWIESEDSPFARRIESMAVYVTCERCKLKPVAVDEIMTTEGARKRPFWHFRPVR